MLHFVYMEQSRPLLAVQNLSVVFTQQQSAFTAVSPISFTLDAGKLLAIVGESGSGKSVTAMALMGLLPAQTIVNGHATLTIQEKSHALLQDAVLLRGHKMSMIFQEPMTALNPLMRCGQQVAEAIRLHQHLSKKEARKKTIALFEQVKLPNPTDTYLKYPHQLSGGQKQRVMIAMAICNNPALLIADEPTTALDVTVQQSILLLLKEIQQTTGMGIVLITHDMGLVADVADHIVVMQQGKLIEQAPAQQLLAAPHAAYTRALLACRPAAYRFGERLAVVADFLQPGTAAVTTTNAPIKAATGQTVLRVQQLCVYYPATFKLFGKKQPAFKAVDDVSFTVQQGEIVGLAGESGCGKTTLSRALLQLLPATSGKIVLNGQELTSLSTKDMQKLRKELQIVFQDPYGSLNPRLSIGEAIMEPMQVHGISHSRQQRKDEVVALLESVNLQADHFNRYPHQFSGGQRQRICIARALSLRPSFLVFDESVSALDVSVQAQVLNLLNDLKAQFGYSAIFISHDLSVVRYISNRVMIMQQGKIVECGDTETVYSHPQHPYTRQLLDAVPGKQLQHFKGTS
jgi:peptide/nickel transport system ATP-binding protein